MNRLFITAATIALGASLLPAQIPANTPVTSKPETTHKAAPAPKVAPKSAPAQRPARSYVTPKTIVDRLTQMENEWVQAIKSKDATKLSAILADDWKGISWSGKVSDKAAVLAALKSGADSLDSIEMGPIEVRAFGSVAVVTGSDTEKSKTDGKDSSGKYAWTDVFVERNGKWTAVASQTAKLP